MQLFQRRFTSKRSTFVRRFSPRLEILEDRMLLSGSLTQFNLVSPDTLNPNVDTFGSSVAVLRNGNVVVTDPTDSTVAPNAGAVFLYNGQTGTLLGELTGSTSGDLVGSGGVTALANGNFVVSSPDWQDGGVEVGAATWYNGNGGPVEAVSPANSLIGSSSGDQVGSGSVTALTNGNYVVRSPGWQNAGAAVGAVTWGNGVAGTTGAVSAGNSLIGSTNFDNVGNGGVTALTNGNYVVSSPFWQNPNGSGGAATWGNGTGGTVGAVSAANSLVAGPNDGSVASSVTALSNGNYVVSSAGWDNGNALAVGAVTWVNGSNAQTFDQSNTIDPANSLIGSSDFDFVGGTGVTALSNGSYVVSSPFWHNGGSVVGAVTRGASDGSTVGPVTTSNSLVGSTAGDDVGSGGVTALSNGNYVVSSPFWQNGGSVVGAVTWGNGTNGQTLDGANVIDAANSLMGSTNNDLIGLGNGNPGSGITALSNGNYVVSSPFWQNGSSVVGAVTWANGTTGIVGPVATSNSLVGSTNNDQVGSGGVTAVTNGNYVVSSPFWQNGGNMVGAVTWANGSTGAIGTVAPGNSLIGSTNNDLVGSGGVTALSNGNYVVSSPGWQSGSAQLGAATWSDGTDGQTLDGANVIDTVNSLVGSGGLLQQVAGLPAGNSFLVSFTGNGGSVFDVQVSGSSSSSSQSISFGPLANQTYGVAPITLSASATSGLPVSFAVLSGPATLSGNVLTVTGVGTVTVEATQPGNANFEAAVPVDQSFTVAPATPTVTVSDAGGTYNGSAFPATATVNGGASLEGVSPTLSYYLGNTHLGGAPSNAGTYTVVAAFAGSADYTSACAHTTFTIAQAATTAVVSSSANPVPHDQLVTFTVTVSGGLAAPFTPTGLVQFQIDGQNAGPAVSLSAGGTATYSTTALFAGSHSVTALYAGNANFQPSTAPTFTQVVLGPGVTLAGTVLYIVGGNTSNDNIQVTPVGASNTGSTGVKVQATLNNVSSTTTFNQAITAVLVFGYAGNDNIQLGNSNNALTLGNGNNNVVAGNGANAATLGNGNNNVQLGNGNDVVTAGNGNNNVVAGNGANGITLGNGNNNVRVGDGNNVVVTGNGNDNIVAGNGDNLIAAGIGQHNVVVGDGSNILIDGTVALTNSSDSLRQVLNDWVSHGASAAANIRSRLVVTYNNSHANHLLAGSGLDWFWETYAQDTTNRKATDLLN
jgi:hypothetical protein